MNCRRVLFGKIDTGGRRGGIGVFLVACVLSWSLFTCVASAAPAPGPTAQNDIIAAAKAAYVSGQSLDAVIAQALKSAAAAGVYVPDMAPALAETLMETGIAQKQDGAALACQISTAMYAALAARGSDNATIFRTMAQTVEGIRAAADRNKLDAVAMQASINACLASVGGDLSTQLAQVVNQAYSQTHAETYTAPGTNGGAGLNGGGSPPSAPGANGIGASGGAFSLSASPSGGP
ncbi:MAG: hypothetical protein P4L43_10425 [Syntrophobacteraceae bacterium]|nr:hypothetical protein [Syntrophobacteraceae bacterium]